MAANGGRSTTRGPSGWGGAVAGGGGGGAPTDGPYVTTAASGGLSNETLIGSIILTPDVFANRPAATGLVAGTIFWATDTLAVYRADGAGAWVTAQVGVVMTTTNQTIGGIKTFSSDPLIPDEVYGSGWNGVLEPPTKNAVYDKLETFDTLAVETPLRFNPSPSAGTQSIQALGVYALIASLTGTTVNTTTAETAYTTANYTAPANQFAIGDLLRLRAWGTYLQNTGSAPTCTFRIRWGGIAGTVLFSLVVPAVADDAAVRVFNLEVIGRFNSNPGFNNTGRLGLAATSTVTDTYSKTTRSAGATVLTLTSSQEFVFTVQPSVSSANQSLVVDGATIEHAKALA